VIGGRQHGSWERRPVSDGSVDVHGLGIIDEATCLRLLRDEHIGRLGLSVGSLPVILPVNFVVDGMTILFRSEDGEKTRAASLGSVACLEVDRIDPFEHDGWSVMATGRLALVPPERVDAYERFPIVPWALGNESRLIELGIELLSGRSIR
jgi:hypothetical protein